jgi:hypothetical protein
MYSSVSALLCQSMLSVTCTGGHYMNCVVLFQVFPYATHPAVLLVLPCIAFSCTAAYLVEAFYCKSKDGWYMMTLLITSTSKNNSCTQNEKENCWWTRVTGMWCSVARFMFSGFSKDVVHSFSKVLGPRTHVRTPVAPWKILLLYHDPCR